MAGEDGPNLLKVSEVVAQEDTGAGGAARGAGG